MEKWRLPFEISNLQPPLTPRVWGVGAIFSESLSPLENKVFVPDIFSYDAYFLKYFDVSR